MCLLFRLIPRKKNRRAVGTHYGPTQIRQARFSLCHRRDGRAGTTIIQLVSTSDDSTKALLSDDGQAGLLEQGQRNSICRSSRIVLRDYRQEEAASSRRRAVNSPGPFQGPLVDWEQRTPPTTPPGPQYLQGTTGRDGPAGWLCQSAPLQADDTTLRPFWSWLKSQSCALDLSQASTRPSTDRARAG